MVMEGAPVCVVETSEFLAKTRRIMDEEERAEMIDFLAFNPNAGVLIPGTGGVRKLRWGVSDQGKRGGARLIYYYHSPEMPLFALTAYTKNRRADLSQAERNGFRVLTMRLRDAYLKRSNP